MRKIHMKGAWRWLVAAGAVFVPATVLGAMTIPHTFTAGTPIKAAEMNENFAAIEEELDKKQEKPASGAFMTSATGNSGYVAATCDTGGCDRSMTFNSTGQLNTVTRQSVGNYKVSLPGLGVACQGICLALTGIPQVTAFGNNSHYCKVKNWVTVNADGTAHVDVACYNASGTAVDSNFTLLYVN